MSPLFDLSYYFSISWEVYLPYGHFCSSVGWLDGFGLSVIISLKKGGKLHFHALVSFVKPRQKLSLEAQSGKPDIRTTDDIRYPDIRPWTEIEQTTEEQFMSKGLRFAYTNIGFSS